MKKKIIIIIIMIVLAIIKQFLVLNLPIIPITRTTVDDQLMVFLADNLKDSAWLGMYSENTLVKGVFCPFFITINHLLGISYISAITLFYTLACFIFMFNMRGIIKNKYVFVLLYVLLLFNPVMASKDILQRVYRNGLIPSLVLIIISCYFQIYFKRNKDIKESVLYSIFTGLALSAFWYTREDSVWILPFIFFIILITIISLWIKNKKINKDFVGKIIVLIIPIIMLILTTNIISFINYKYYGIYTTNELTNSNFTKALKSIYSVKSKEETQWVSVPRAKIEKIVEVSPSMKYIEPYLKETMDMYSVAGREKDDEVENGWFFWALRLAVGYAGKYKDAQTANEFYFNLHCEIEDAIKEGKLESQPTMPSALMPPWREGNLHKLIKSYGEMLGYISTFEEIQIVDETKDQYLIMSPEELDRFRKITKNEIIYPQNAVYDNGEKVVEPEYQEEYMSSINYKINILNAIVKIYQSIGLILSVVGIISYVLITIKLIINAKVKNFELIDVWVLLSGMIGSFFSLTIGVAYNHISSCYSITYLYLVGTYPLLIAFSCIGTYILIKKILIKN